MSETNEPSRSSRAKRRGDHRAPNHVAGASGPGGDHDQLSDSAPMEQGGAASDFDPAYSSGQSPLSATPPGPEASQQAGGEPLQEAGEPLAGDEQDAALAPFDDQGRRQLVLVKNGHRYVFRYERGEETKVLAGLVEMARDPKSELDWFDAAVLSHQLGQRMSEQLERLRRA